MVYTGYKLDEYKKSGDGKAFAKIAKALKDGGKPIRGFNDGEEDANIGHDEAIAVMSNLDECHFFTKGGSWFFFLNGEGQDCIADYTTDLEPILGPVMEWIEKKYNKWGNR